MFPGIIKAPRGLPWWLSDKELASQCRGHEFSPWSGKIPCATEQLSPCATQLLSLCSAARRATAMRNRLTATREKPTCKEDKQQLEQCLACSRHSVNTCWTSEWTNEVKAQLRSLLLGSTGSFLKQTLLRLKGVMLGRYFKGHGASCNRMSGWEPRTFPGGLANELLLKEGSGRY